MLLELVRAAPPPRVPAPVQHSDWYYRRLDVQRVGSYAMLPLFVAQFAGVGVLMASNTVTGVWTLTAPRSSPSSPGPPAR